MKLKIKQIDGEDTWVAQIQGLDAHYGFAREFLKGTVRQLRSAKGKPQRREYTFELDDGLFEICQSGDREYVAIVRNRRILLKTNDVEATKCSCESIGFDLLQVFSVWATSPKRSSESFARIAEELTEERRAERNAKKRQSREFHAARRRERVRSMTARNAFDGSNAADTKAFLKRLQKVGANGLIAAELFRCQKSSTRAKKYRRDYSGLAYERKGEVIGSLCRLLLAQAEWKWGWKKDPNEDFASWVLYVELPQGQISFHAPERGDGPDYARDWDRQRASEARILAYCDSLLAKELPETEPLCREQAGLEKRSRPA